MDAQHRVDVMYDRLKADSSRYRELCIGERGKSGNARTTRPSLDEVAKMIPQRKDAVILYNR